jgi:hypothetical protein
MTRYTKQVAEMLHAAKAPHRGFKMDIAELEDSLVLVIYKDNLSSYTKEQQEDLAIFVINLVKKLQSITTIYIEVKQDDSAIH